MKIGKITYGSQSSNEFGLIVAGAGTFNPALPDMTSYSVPGKNGDVILDNHRYKNIDVKYPGFIADAFIGNAQGIRNWILSGKEYKELSDNFDTTHFRLAIGKDVSFSPVNENKAANMSITFNCKPQRFLVSGTTGVTITPSAILENPTGFEARPRITIIEAAQGATITFTKPGYTTIITAIEDMTDYAVIIDSETMTISDLYTHENLADKFNISNGLPVLKSGQTSVTCSGVSSASLRPRWWEL